MRRLIMSLWRDFTHAFSGWSGIVLAALLGVVLGVGLFTVQYSGVTDYLGDDPATCANCHAMREQYEGWQKRAATMTSPLATPVTRRTTASSTSTSTRRTTVSGTR